MDFESKNRRVILNFNMNKDLRTILLATGLLYLAFMIGTSFTVEGERYFTLVDDAMISMRYPRHLAGGNGLVWNVGEKPVQGFTNLGWTLLMGALHLLPLPASMISLTIMFTSAAILLSNIYIVFKIADTLSPDSKHAPILAALVTAFYFPLVFWSLRGMEVGLLVMLINLALLLSLNNGNPLLISLVLALVIIVRIDAVISALLISIYIVIKHRSGASTLPLLAIIFTSLGLFLFQLTYFGDLLPTTYYQKVAGYTLWEVPDTASWSSTSLPHATPLRFSSSPSQVCSFTDSANAVPGYYW